MRKSHAEDAAEQLLPQLDDSNTVSSYKNERAAYVIRLLMNELGVERAIGAQHKADADKLRTASVFLVQYNYFADDYSYGHWEETPDVESGYFASREAAQAEADRLNGYDKRYADYVRGVENKNAQIQERHDRALVAYGTLVASGIENPDQFMKKPEIHLNKIDTFEDWKAEKTRRRESYHDVVEVERHA